MLLWKEAYKETSAGEPHTHDDEDDARPWKNWPRPPGGFVDVGCGNGLLVHILNSEGYTGYGYDIRSRTSWSHYPENTRANLRVAVFDPFQLSSADRHTEDNGVQFTNDAFIPRGAFIIANHADELTPWTPLMAILSSASGYLSIPCCAWMFDRKFSREQAKSGIEGLPEDQVLKLNLGEEGMNSNGSYARYRRWLAAISWKAGWEIDCDTLRIPSTRNWAILGK
jgi:tRNASer (uridine44-2'-O)-methyltransferase